MCLIAWNWQPGTDTPLVLLANRDEFFARPTRVMQWWDGANILAGQDLRAGGTWLGLSRSGRFAALTNYRDPANVRADAPSRGRLVSDFLQADMSATDYLTALAPLAHRYNPFNLLVLADGQFMGFESRHARVFAVPPGVGAVSNADFNAPWPKLLRIKGDLAIFATQGAAKPDALFEILKNSQLAPSTELPQTGIPLVMEQSLSAIFINMPGYGTRASTLVRQTPTRWEMWERSFDQAGGQAACQAFNISA